MRLAAQRVQNSRSEPHNGLIACSTPVLILSDEQIGSYPVIGDLLARTLEAVGVPVRHLPLSAARRPGGIHRGTIAIQNTIGPRFAPLAGCRNIAMVHHEWDRYPQAWVRSLNEFAEVWVTTAFVKRTLLNSGVVRPILLLRPALDLDVIPLKTDYRIRHPVRLFACGAPHFRKGSISSSKGSCGRFHARARRSSSSTPSHNETGDHRAQTSRSMTLGSRGIRCSRAIARPICS